MSEIADKLASCTHITEWVDPWDKRLEEIAGTPVPEAGGDLRGMWELDGGDEALVVAKHVRRLLVREAIILCDAVTSRFNNNPFGDEVDMDVGSGNVELDFTDPEDWKTCFPIIEKSAIFKSRDGMQAWAGIALCERKVGLAIFAQAQDSGAVLARIQPMPDEALQRM